MIVVLLNLIVSDNGTICSYCFLKVRRIPAIVLSGLSPKSSIRIGWILHHGRSHSTVFLFTKPAATFFNDCLFGKASDKKLVFRYVVKVMPAVLQQLIGIVKDDFYPIDCFLAAVVIENLIVIIWIIVMLKTNDQIISSVFVKIDYNFCDTSIEQFNAAEVSNVCLDHHGIHTADPRSDPHHLRNLFTKICHTIMKEIYIMQSFVVITSLSKSRQ